MLRLCTSAFLCIVCTKHLSSTVPHPFPFPRIIKSNTAALVSQNSSLSKHQNNKNNTISSRASQLSVHLPVPTMGTCPSRPVCPTHNQCTFTVNTRTFAFACGLSYSGGQLGDALPVSPPPPQSSPQHPPELILTNLAEKQHITTEYDKISDYTLTLIDVLNLQLHNRMLPKPFLHHRNTRKWAVQFKKRKECSYTEVRSPLLTPLLTYTFTNQFSPQSKCHLPILLPLQPLSQPRSFPLTPLLDHQNQHPHKSRLRGRTRYARLDTILLIQLTPRPPHHFLSTHRRLGLRCNRLLHHGAMERVTPSIS
jgi:hypothetical protein